MEPETLSTSTDWASMITWGDDGERDIADVGGLKALDDFDELDALIGEGYLDSHVAVAAGGAGGVGTGDEGGGRLAGDSGGDLTGNRHARAQGGGALDEAPPADGGVNTHVRLPFLTSGRLGRPSGRSCALHCGQIEFILFDLVRLHRHVGKTPPHHSAVRRMVRRL